MPSPMNAPTVLDHQFPEMRCRILDLAAAFDRLERAAGAEQARQDQRYRQLVQAVGVLLDGRPDRATRVLMVFSDPYDADWPRPAKAS